MRGVLKQGVTCYGLLPLLKKPLDEGDLIVVYEICMMTCLPMIQVSKKLYGRSRRNVTCFIGVAEAQTSRGNGVRQIHLYFCLPKLGVFLVISAGRISLTRSDEISNPFYLTVSF